MPDLERMHYLADREKVSAATWLRQVAVRALDAEVPKGTPLACSECRHMPSEHTRNGCTVEQCRCPKYRRPT
jgi:hypothetical protein